MNLIQRLLLFLAISCSLTASAVDVIPNPYAPGNIGANSNRFVIVYVLTLDASNRMTLAGQTITNWAGLTAFLPSATLPAYALTNNQSTDVTLGAALTVINGANIGQNTFKVDQGAGTETFGFMKLNGGSVVTNNSSPSFNVVTATGGLTTPGIFDPNGTGNGSYGQVLTSHGGQWGWATPSWLIDAAQDDHIYSRSNGLWVSPNWLFDAPRMGTPTRAATASGS